MTPLSITPARIAALLAASAGIALPAILPAQEQQPTIVLPSDEELARPTSHCSFKQELAEAAQEEEGFVMPTTGLVFTLPSDEAEEAVEPEELHHCAAAPPPPPVRPPDPSLFRMVALPVGYGTAPMRKWDSVRLANLAEHAGPWDELLGQANQMTAGNPLGMVNRWVNWNVRYKDDMRGDEWSSAPATLIRGYGDCEDFALAKMALLDALGIPAEDMYLVLLRDRAQGEHAVLAVKQGGRLFILDNRTDKVLPASVVDDYTPIVSYSGPFAWIYGEVAR